MKLMTVTVRGREKNWCFSFYGDPAHFPDWVADGLDVVQIENTVPMNLPNWVPVRAWTVLQDIFNFKNPFRK